MNPPISSLAFRIGTIGFAYPEWQGVFYPGSLGQTDRLAAYAEAFDTVELDTTFYAIPPRERVEKWAGAVPDGFTFCVKTPRAITHDAPLGLGVGGMRLFLEALEPLREAGKLGPVLIQLPPTFQQYRHPELGAFLGSLPREVRFAVELRHRSWWVESTAALLAGHGAAWVAADYSRKVWPVQVTADFLYVRFVGVHHRFEGSTREQIDVTPALEEWRERLRAAAARLPVGAAVFSLFTNDYAGHAPATANRLREVLGLAPRMIVEKSASGQGSLF